jgi:hypothetical protein
MNKASANESKTNPIPRGWPEAPERLSDGLDRDGAVSQIFQTSKSVEKTAYRWLCG